MKRKRKGRKTVREMRERRLENWRGMYNLIDTVLDEVSIQHDCKYSQSCPSWSCWSCTRGRERQELERNLRNLEKNISNLVLDVDMEVDIHIEITDTEHGKSNIRNNTRITSSPVSDIMLAPQYQRK